jgi:metal-responsive CopG/Arc/MetJ family transcriptional regulator
VRVSLSLQADVLNGIDRLAAKAKVSRSAFIETVLRQYLRMKPESSRER